MNCDDCLFNIKNFQRYQALCRLIFLQYLIGPHFEPDLSLRLDAVLEQLEAIRERRRGAPVHVGEVVGEVMANLEAERQGRARAHLYHW